MDIMGCEKTCLWGFQPAESKTSLLSYRDQLEYSIFACRKSEYYHNQRVKTKGADQTAWMRWLICPFVVSMQHNKFFSRPSPYGDHYISSVFDSSAMTLTVFGDRPGICKGQIISTLIST